LQDVTNTMKHINAIIVKRFLIKIALILERIYR
jgi:hypothetical protein